MIEIKNLSYKTNNKMILDNVTLEIEDNKLYAIIGPNGAGKSTLLKHMMHILKAPKETILIDGRDINCFTTREYAQKCSCVFQENTRAFDYTVEEIISMGRYPYMNVFGTMKRQDHTIVSNIIQDLGLESLRKESLKNLSGGEAQKVFVGRALAQQTPILLLDEPTSMLDIHSSIELLCLLKKIQQKYKLTIIMVMHDLNLAFQFCEEIIVLKNGRLLIQANKDTVLSADVLQNIYHNKIETIHYQDKTYIVPKI